MLKTQTMLDDYLIIRLLGKGGMGEVYEAQQTNPARRVALKVLAPWLAEDAEALERFWREANVPAQLDHPGIVRIFATGKTNGVAYYVMQLVRGISLSELLRKASEPLPETQHFPKADTSHSDTGKPSGEDPSPAEFLPGVVDKYRQDKFGTLAWIGIQAARALDSAHRQNYLHRDIKPSNLMIDRHNQLYLVDFGLTRALDSGTGTRVGALVGTPWYMSPEQAQGQPLDARSDIYSLGVTLYQLATGGKGPYLAPRDDSDAVLREVRSGVRQPLSKLAPALPARLAAIITRAIHSDPEKRYQAADHLAADLEEFLKPGTSVQRLPPLPFRSTGQKPAAGASFSSWIGAAVILLLLVGAGLGAYLHLIRTSEGEKPLPPEPNPLQPALVKQPEQPPVEQFQRDRPRGTRLNLLREDNQPVLKRIVSGQGKLQPLDSELVLQTEGEKPFLLALDNPGNQSFDLSLELRAPHQFLPQVNDLGIFFGWRDQSDDPMTQIRFFAIMLDTRPVLNDINGRLSIGTWQLGDPRTGKQTIWEANPKPFTGPSSVPLGQGNNGWHLLEVTVRDQKFSIAADNGPAKTFVLDELRRMQKGLKAVDLDTGGCLGLWVRKGVGHFRNVTLTPR